MRALSLPGCGCRGAFQFAVMARLAARGETFDLVAGASSGSVCAAAVVAGLAERGPALWRTFSGVPVVSRRWVRAERSPFGMSAIVRGALEEHLPERLLVGTRAELLVSTTRARDFFGPGRGAVIHSNRARDRFHEVLLASCYIPVVYARPTRLEGELHFDGGASDNTLLAALAGRGATDITVVTPTPRGAVARTLFSPELPPRPPPGTRLRLVYPERALTQRRFAFDPGPLEEALAMPQVEEIVER